MTQVSGRVLFWAPRALSIAFIAFISLFALDVFEEGNGLWKTLLALMIHLIPSFILVAILAAAWRREWIGAAAFAGAGMLYVLMLLPRPTPSPATKLVWCLLIAGPAFVVAALFWVNWLKHAELR